MSGAGRIAKNAGYLTLARGGALSLNFVLWAYLARVLGAGPFGQIGVALAIVGYFALMVRLGFDAVAMRELARAPERLASLVGDVILLRSGLLVIAGCAYLGILAALPWPPGHKAVLAVIGLQLVATAFQVDWVFIATERAGVVAARELAASALLVAGTLTLVHGPEDVVTAAALVAGAPLLSTAAMWHDFRRSHKAVDWRINSGVWRGLLAAAVPLAASTIMIEIYTSIDRVMLEGLRTTEEAGLYFGASKILSVALMPAAVLTPAFFASLASALGDRTAMRERGRRYARALLAFGVPIALAGPILAEAALVFVNGDAFAAASPALAVLLVNAGVIYINMALGTPLMTWNLQVPYMWVVVTGGAANVALNVALIPAFGIEGAAVATLTSEAIVGVGLIVLYRRATGDVPLGSLVRVVPAALVGAAAPAALGAWLGWPVLASVALGLVGYGAAAWAFGVVDRAWARDVLRQRFSRFGGGAR